MGKNAYFMVDGIKNGKCVAHYQCVKCDFHTTEKHLILGHLASEHLPKRFKRKESLCLKCGFSVSTCKKTGTCSEAKKKNRENIISLDTTGTIP